MKSILLYTLQSCILMVLGCFSVPGLSSANDLDTAKVQWHKYFADYEPNIQSTSDEQITSGTRTQRNIRQCIQTKLNSLIIATMGYAEDKYLEVYGINQYYSFSLAQKIPSKEAVLINTKLMDSTKQERPKYYSITSPHFTYENISLPEFVNHPDVTVVELEQDNGYFVINFSYIYRYRGHPYRTHQGKLFLDPTNFYCINRSLVTIVDNKSSAEEVVVETNYTYSTDDVPLIQLKKSTAKNKDSTNQFSVYGETVTNYDAKIAQDIDPKQFRLSHYGLPEPEGVVWRDPRPLWHWLLGGVILTSLLAILFRVWAKRARLKTVTPTTVE
ncbi:MAG: hypothetical protein R3B84_23080 [Zavarzinella sp.]